MLERLSGVAVAANNGNPQTPQLQQPQKQQPRKPKPWFCGTGNSWSHPFTAPTGKQWGIWSTSDLIIAAGIGKFTGGKDPFSMVFTDAVCRGPRRTEQFPTQSPHQKDLLSRWG